MYNNYITDDNIYVCNISKLNTFRFNLPDLFCILNILDAINISVDYKEKFRGRCFSIFLLQLYLLSSVK